MRHEPIPATRFFFATGPMPCPYLAGRVERRIVTELSGRDAPALHDVLSLAGFRRSHDIAYAPACPDCTECRAIRIRADEFEPSRSMRRVVRVNTDLRATAAEPVATDEQFDLFSAYQEARHGGGEMARMDANDYRALVENSPVETKLTEFRAPDDSLAACCLVDHLGDGLSAVYSFFDATLKRRSLGTLMILWTIEQTRELGLPHTYLGFWIAECTKMSYKARFAPAEIHTPEGWRRLDEVVRPAS